MGKSTGFMEYERQTSKEVPPLERIKNFNEFHEPLSMEEQRKQAARCMDCGVPFCQYGKMIAGMASGCPLNNLVPEWNDNVYTGNMEMAYKRLSKTNNFPEFTSRVCPALCEAACTCNINGDPVCTKENERSIIENAYEKGYVNCEPPKVRSGKRVAIVGSGPSGLAAADQISTGFRAVKIFVFEVQQLIDTHSTGQKSNYHLPGGRVLLAQDQRHLFVRENLAFRRFASFDFQDRCKVGIHDTPANGCAIQLTDKSTLFFQHTLRQAVIGHLIKDVLEVLRIEGGNFEVPQWTKIFPRNVIELASLIGPALIFTGLFEHPEAVLQGRVLIGCGRTLHHFGADSFCFFTGDVGANSLHDCNSGVRIRDRHSEQPWFPACSGHSCDAAIARRGFQPGRFSFGWNGRWSYCTGGWRCANGMPAGRAEFSGI